MFEFIWRHLPGPKWLRFIEVLVLLFVIVALLFEFAFPWLVENTRIMDNVVSN